MYGYHTDTLYELRPTSCTDVLRRCVRIAPTYAIQSEEEGRNDPEIQLKRKDS